MVLEVSKEIREDGFRSLLETSRTRRAGLFDVSSEVVFGVCFSRSGWWLSCWLCARRRRKGVGYRAYSLLVRRLFGGALSPWR